MALVQSFINLDDLYMQTDRRVILNDLRITQDNLKDLIYTTTGENISMIPQCECGFYTSGFRLNKICPKCHTSVIRPFDNMQPLLWVKKFRDDLPWINPKFWKMLSMIISIKVDGLRYLADTSYNPPKLPLILPMLAEVIGGRSYVNVVNKIELIITFLKNNSSYKTLVKRIKLNIIHTLYKKKKHILTFDTLPLINKKLFISEKSKDGSYDTMLLADIIDLALLIITTANDVDQSDKRLQNSTAKIISKSATLFAGYMKDLVSRKGGLARKNIYGGRAHFTFRAVISSLDPMYDYDTLHVPYIVGISSFRPHLINKLLAKGLTQKKASAKIFRGAKVFDQELYDIMCELIDEAPDKGIPVFFNRNPSLGLGSIGRFFITKFHENVRDETIHMSKLVVTAFNADFDGDQMNVTIILDNYLAKLAEHFAPHYNAPTIGAVYEIGGNVNLPKTQAIILSNYLFKEEEEDEKCAIYDMLTNIDLNLATNKL